MSLTGKEKNWILGSVLPFFREAASFSLSSSSSSFFLLYFPSTKQQQRFLFIFEAANETLAHWQETFCFTISKRSGMAQIGENSAPLFSLFRSPARCHDCSATTSTPLQPRVRAAGWMSSCGPAMCPSAKAGADGLG